MANVMTPVDVYTVVNAMAQSMFGANTEIQAVDTSSFVSVGEAMLRSGYENTLNALGMQIARTLFAVRPYSGKFGLINQIDAEYGAIIRKISYFYDGAEQSTDWNTNLAAEQLNDGNSIDHYKIRKRYPLEINFSGIKVLQKSFTRFRKQLKIAFRSEEEFSNYYAGLMVEIANEIRIIQETENRLTVLNHIGGVYNTGTTRMKVNLTAGYNTKFGTSYTSAQLRSEYLKDFLAYMVSTIKYTSDLMEEASTAFHLTPVKHKDDGTTALQLLRHTPKSMQRLFLLRPLMLDAEAQVLPEIFNDNYLKIENYEGVNFWQDLNNPGSVSVTPNQFNATTGASETGAAVTKPYIVGLMFDRDALATNYKVDDVVTTPVNAAGDYYNTFYHWCKNYLDDFTENSVLFYMEDEAGG